MRDDLFWISFVVKPGPKLPAERFAAVPRTYRLRRMGYQAWRLAIPRPDHPEWRFEAHSTQRWAPPPTSRRSSSRTSSAELDAMLSRAPRSESAVPARLPAGRLPIAPPSGSDRRGAKDLAFVGVQRGQPAGVHEEHARAVFERAAARQADQAGHHLAGVDGIEQHALGARQDLDRLHHARVRDEVLGRQ